jgi:hypothetical protein
MTRAPAPRRGFAVILTLFFVLLCTAMLGVLFRIAAATVRIESQRAVRSRCDEGSNRAMARALALLETGLPPQDPYVCAATINTPGGPRCFTVTFTGEEDGETWRIRSEPTLGALSPPPMPDSFASPP